MLEQEDTSKVVQCFSYSIASFVPLVFNTQPTKSGLHTFPLRRQIAQYSFISVRAGTMYIQFYGIKIMFRSNTVPGIVSFIVQLHSTSFTVVWQV